MLIWLPAGEIELTHIHIYIMCIIPISFLYEKTTQNQTQHRPANFAVHGAADLKAVDFPPEADTAAGLKMCFGMAPQNSGPPGPGAPGGRNGAFCRRAKTRSLAHLPQWAEAKCGKPANPHVFFVGWMALARRGCDDRFVWRPVLTHRAPWRFAGARWTKP